MRAILIGALLGLPAIAACGNSDGPTTDTSTDGPDTAVDTLPDDGPDTVVDSPPDTPDAVDVPPDEGPWPCTPAFAESPRTILGGPSVSVGPADDPDRPELITLYEEVVWLVARIVGSPGSTDVPKLTLVMVNPRTALPNSELYSPLVSGPLHGTLDLAADHPAAAFVDPWYSSIVSPAIAFADLTGILSNRMSYMLLGYPPAEGAMAGFEGSDEHASDPAVASSGDELLVVWRQGNATDGTSALHSGRVDTSGTVSGTGTIWETGTRDVGQPTLVHNGTQYGLAFFVHAGPALDEVDFVELAADGSPVSSTWATYDTTESGNVLVGRPSLAWTGSRYTLMWEEVGVAPMLNLATIDPGGVPVDHVTLEGDLYPHVGTTSHGQPGMLDMVWTGHGYGILWVHQDPATGTHVWFFELDPDARLSGTPVNLNPDSTQSHNPTITWKGDSRQHYFVFAWVEFSSMYGWHVLYTYSYGCESI